MLVDGGSFAMHIIHLGTYCTCTFCRWCLQKSRQWRGKLAAISGPSSGMTRSGANMPMPSTSTTRNGPSCERIDSPAANARLGQRRASFAESTSRCREEMSCEALEAPHEKAPGSGTGWAWASSERAPKSAYERLRNRCFPLSGC